MERFKFQNMKSLLEQTDTLNKIAEYNINTQNELCFCKITMNNLKTHYKKQSHLFHIITSETIKYFGINNQESKTTCSLKTTKH